MLSSMHMYVITVNYVHDDDQKFLLIQCALFRVSYGLDEVYWGMQLRLYKIIAN